MKQGEQAWLLSSGGGNHEFARLFWCAVGDKEARYRVGQGGDPKLGPFTLLSVNCSERGAELVWSDGRQSFLPAAWYQLTYAH